MVRAPSELAWTALMGDEYVLAWEMVMWMVIGVDSLRGKELVGMGWGSMEWEIGRGLGVGVSGDARGGIWSVYVLAPSELAWTALMGDEYVSAWEMVMWMVIGVDGLQGRELVGMGR